MFAEHLVRSLFIASLVLLMTACAAANPSAPKPLPTEAADPELPYPPPRTPVVGDILHLPTGRFVSEEQMLRTVTDARVVYVGETHDNPASHRQQLTVLRALFERYPGEVALGMEMFNPTQQDALDRWIAGELSEREFLRTSRWYDVWRMDFDYYRDLLVFARDHRIPVIGLNAERSAVQAVRSGEGPLGDTLDDPYHRALVEAVFGGHGHAEGGLETFIEVQTLWDETMAEGVARHLEQNPSVRMLVVAGANHVRYGFGIPRRAFFRFPHSYALVGSREIDIPEDKEDRFMEVDLPSFPMPPYHFVAFTRYEDLGIERVRLGVMLGEEDGFVVVQGVLPGSAAQKGGIRKGEKIVAIDGERVESSFDVIYAVRKKTLGDSIRLTLAHEETEREVEIRFEPDSPDEVGASPQ